MQIPRRALLQLVGAAATAPALPLIARAQTYPARPITMIVPFAAGGTTDVIGRVVAERMGQSLGQPIIIENVTGADGIIGTGRAARARPDGYTIEIGNLSTNVLNGAFYSLPFDIVNGFAPVSLLVTNPIVLFTRKTVPADNLNALISWLKANSEKASAGVANVGLHLLTAFFQKETGTRFALIPYRGLAPVMQDLVAGQIDLSLGATTELPLMRSGNIKAYAATSDTRLALAPDIPTFHELGLPSLSYSNWHGIFVPKGTPKDIVSKLNAAIVEALVLLSQEIESQGRGLF